MLRERLLHRERGAERALGVVLVRHRRAEDHEDRVADELLDRAFVALGLAHERLEDVAHELLELLGIERLRERGEADDVGEEDGDETPFLHDLWRRALRGHTTVTLGADRALLADPPPEPAKSFLDVVERVRVREPEVSLAHRPE